MIGMRAMRRSFYLELIYAKIVLLIQGWFKEHLFSEVLLIIVQVNRSMRNIK